MNSKIFLCDILSNQSKGALAISALIAVFFAVVIVTYNLPPTRENSKQRQIATMLTRSTRK